MSRIQLPSMAFNLCVLADNFRTHRLCAKPQDISCLAGIGTALQSVPLWNGPWAHSWKTCWWAKSLAPNRTRSFGLFPDLPTGSQRSSVVVWFSLAFWAPWMSPSTGFVQGPGRVASETIQVLCTKIVGPGQTINAQWPALQWLNAQTIWVEVVIFFRQLVFSTDASHEIVRDMNFSLKRRQFF